MELKVWVEGIQRIVCGVNDKTTCQDVVFALAHATGKTGRFTLVERWRNSERLLAPSEHPLKVLTKWGEHSNDVQLILQWSPLDGAASAKPTGVMRSPENPTEFQQSRTAHSITSGSQHNSFQDSLERGINSSETSSVNASFSSPKTVLRINEENPFGNEDSRRNPNLYTNGRTSLVNERSFQENDGFSRSKLKDLNICKPPPYRAPPSPPKDKAPVKELPPYRGPPPPSSKSSMGGGMTTTNSNSPASTHSSGSYGNSSPGGMSFRGISGSQLRQSPRQNTSTTSSPSPCSSSFPCMQNQASSSGLNGMDCNTPGIQNGLQRTQFLPHHDREPEYHELVQLINVQREQLTNQQAELTQYDAEIMFWEGKAREQQRHVEYITKEINRLELLSSQQDSQMLSLSHLEEENNLITNESEHLTSELSSLRSELLNCEKELVQCKNRISVLMDELEITRLEEARREQDWLRREAEVFGEIERLRSEIEQARREVETVADVSGSLEQEVTTLETTLGQKKKQMERLLSAMKEANLQSLAIQPPEEIVDGGTHHRTGSTRRMIGSPRQLENAAPTSRNPHGIFV